MTDDEIEMGAEEAMMTLKFALDRTLNGEQVKTNPDAKRRNGFVLMLFPYEDRSGRCYVISNGITREEIVGMMRFQVEDFDKREEAMATERRERGEPFDVATNMARVNSIMHEFRDRKITREECKQRLMDECKVADYNLDTLMNVYDPDKQEPDE
jgi:hypothetical protein